MDSSRDHCSDGVRKKRVASSFTMWCLAGNIRVYWVPFCRNFFLTFKNDDLCCCISGAIRDLQLSMDHVALQVGETDLCRYSSVIVIL